MALPRYYSSTFHNGRLANPSVPFVSREPSRNFSDRRRRIHANRVMLHLRISGLPKRRREGCSATLVTFAFITVALSLSAAAFIFVALLFSSPFYFYTDRDAPTIAVPSGRRFAITVIASRNKRVVSSIKYRAYLTARSPTEHCSARSTLPRFLAFIRDLRVGHDPRAVRSILTQKSLPHRVLLRSRKKSLGESRPTSVAPRRR